MTESCDIYNSDISENDDNVSITNFKLSIWQGTDSLTWGSIINKYGVHTVLPPDFCSCERVLYPLHKVSKLLMLILPVAGELSEERHSEELSRRNEECLALIGGKFWPAVSITVFPYSCPKTVTPGFRNRLNSQPETWPNALDNHEVYEIFSRL